MGARKSPSEVKVESRLSRVTESMSGEIQTHCLEQSRQINDISSIDHGVLLLHAILCKDEQCAQ